MGPRTNRSGSPTQPRDPSADGSTRWRRVPARRRDAAVVEPLVAERRAYLALRGGRYRFVVPGAAGEAANAMEGVVPAQSGVAAKDGHEGRDRGVSITWWRARHGGSHRCDGGGLLRGGRRLSSAAPPFGARLRNSTPGGGGRHGRRGCRRHGMGFDANAPGQRTRRCRRCRGGLSELLLQEDNAGPEFLGLGEDRPELRFAIDV